MKKNRYFDIISKFEGKKVLVVGDIMLDIYYGGDTNRISQEAPVPIVKITYDNMKIGGAGNVASNISELGAIPSLIGVLGDDIYGDKLKAILKGNNIIPDNIIFDNKRQTTVKTRIVSQGQQMIRFDQESIHNISDKIEQKVSKSIENILCDMDAVIIADYGKGVLTQSLISKIFCLSKLNNIPINVDPKFGDFNCFSHAHLLKPNVLEFQSVVGIWDTESDFIKVGNEIRKKLNLDLLLVTRGEKGCTLFDKSKSVSIPTKAIKVHDVSGAGDTVVSTFTLAELGGADGEEASFLANIAAGYVCGELGVTPVSVKNLTKSVKSYLT